MSEAVISGLLQRKEQIEQEVAAKKKDLRTINAALKLFSPPTPRLKRGTISRKIFDILRNATEPLTCRAIAIQMVGEDSTDLDITAKRIGIALCGYRKKGLARVASEHEYMKRWETV